MSLGWKWDPEAQRWRLLSYHVDIPKELRDEVPAPELTKPKREAPSEVVELTRTTLERIRDGKAAEVYAEAHDIFKGSVDLQRFLDLIDKRTREMGKYVRIIDFTKTGKNERENAVRARVKEIGIPFVYVNTVGGQDELVFDGGSFAMNADGEVSFRAEPFKETLLKLELRADSAGVRPEPGEIAPRLDAGR